MKIFLSYAAANRVEATEIALAIRGSNHDVFFDNRSLKAGHNYNEILYNAVSQSDAFVFLISPASIRSRSYALTELKFAEEKWAHPHGYVLPVLLHPTASEAIPAYLRAVTILQPQGNVAAEIVHAIRSLSPFLTDHNSRMVQVMTHLAYFASNLDVENMFINVVNRYLDRDIEITHVWLDTTPKIFALQRSRPLPVRLKPNESWETWVRAVDLPPSLRDKPFQLARVRLSTGEVLASVRNTTVPEFGQVPGGPIYKHREL